MKTLLLILALIPATGYAVTPGECVTTILDLKTAAQNNSKAYKTALLDALDEMASDLEDLSGSGDAMLCESGDSAICRQMFEQFTRQLEKAYERHRVSSYVGKKNDFRDRYDEILLSLNGPLRDICPALVDDSALSELQSEIGEDITHTKNQFATFYGEVRLTLLAYSKVESQINGGERADILPRLIGVLDDASDVLIHF